MIALPSLSLYKETFLKKGVSLPLPVVPYKKNGLLAELPQPPANKTGWPWTEETAPAVFENNKTWPKITIVTPSYNQADFLEETIRSVLLQNYPNLEYIIIDGGSTDRSNSIIEKYSPWLSYRQSGKDLGQGHAINQGFSIASGSYFAWINSDDYYLKNVLREVSVIFLDRHVDFIYGYSYNYNVAEQAFKLIKTDLFLDYFIRLPNLIQPSCFWSAAIHQPVWEDLQCSMDYELWLRILKGQSRQLLRKPLSVAHVHKDAKTYNPKMLLAWEHDHKLICSPEAHGPVNDWNKRAFLKKIYHRLNILLEKLSLT